MRFSILPAILPALAAALPLSAPTTSDSGLQTYQVPMAIPDELSSLINENSQMFVSNPTGSLLGPVHAQTGQFDTTTRKATVSNDYIVPLALLPPSLVDRTAKDVGILISQGPGSVTDVVVGALTFDEVKNPSDKMLKERQAPITGPIGNFIAQLIGSIW